MISLRSCEGFATAHVGEVFLAALVGLLPVIGFLAVLLFLDSYKLVRLPVMVAIVAAASPWRGPAI